MINFQGTMPLVGGSGGHNFGADSCPPTTFQGSPYLNSLPYKPAECNLGQRALTCVATWLCGLVARYSGGGETIYQGKKKTLGLVDG